MPIIKRATASIILKYMERKKDCVSYIRTCTKNKATRTTDKEEVERRKENVHGVVHPVKRILQNQIKNN